jgi:mRNA interferase HigB
MRVTNTQVIEQYIKNHADTKGPLTAWLNEVKQANWQSFNDIRKDFPSADKVKNHYIFDIKGNKYRLVVKIVFLANTVKIDGVFTHPEYDKIDFKKRK